MSKFKVGDKVRALANPTSKYYSNDGYFKVGEEFTVKEVFPVQGTISLVERDSCWAEERFELVNEGPSSMAMTSFKVGDKVRRKVNDRSYSAWSHGDRVLTVSAIEKYRDQQVLMFKEVADVSDGFRFELVEEAKSTPSMPQNTSFKAGDKVRRKVEDLRTGEWSRGLEVLTVRKVNIASGYQIICIEGVQHGWDGWDGFRFELVEEAKPAVEPQLPGVPEGFRAVRIGTPKKGEWFVDGCDNAKQCDGWQTVGGYVILEKIGQPSPSESPDDLVIQDRVPSRAGIDFGWWVSPGEFDRFQPTLAHAWGIGIGHRDGLMHGYKHEGCSDRLAVMCYRKDLPESPTVERVVLDEYLVWDTDGPKCLLWSTSNPTIQTDSLDAWDHAYLTGNTREIEVPIVKP